MNYKLNMLCLLPYWEGESALAEVTSLKAKTQIGKYNGYGILQS